MKLINKLFYENTCSDYLYKNLITYMDFQDFCREIDTNIDKSVQDLFIDNFVRWNLKYDNIPDKLKYDINFLSKLCLKNKNIVNQIEKKDYNLYMRIVIRCGEVTNEIKVANKII